MTSATVAFQTLGCKLNFSETSTIARDFVKYGFEKVKFDSGADFYVINTCSVTENADKEAKKLQELFLNVHHLGSVLEIGTYCGKSTLNFALIAKKIDGLIYTVDHHTGSEEHQLGEEYHDEDLYDKRLKKFNTLSEFLKNLRYLSPSSQMATASNGYSPKWLQPRTATAPNGYSPKWLQPQMATAPNGYSPK